MSRYRDDRAALEDDGARLRAELDDALARLDAIDGRTAGGRPDTEIDVALGADGALGVPSSIRLSAELDEAVDATKREAIASLLRTRLGLSMNVGASSVRSTDGRFVLETKGDRTSLHLDWAFDAGERVHHIRTALTTIAATAAGASLLLVGLDVGTTTALSSILWIAPVAGAILAPLLRAPAARQVMLLQEQVRDAFRAAVDLAEGDERDEVPAHRYRVEEPVAASDAYDEAGDFEGDAELGDDEDEASEDEASEDDEASEADEASEDEADDEELVSR